LIANRDPIATCRSSFNPTETFAILAAKPSPALPACGNVVKKSYGLRFTMKFAYKGGMNVTALIWVVIVITGIIDGFLLFAEGIAIGSNWTPVIFCLCMAGLSIAFRRIPPIRRLFAAVAQICAFSFVGAILTYAAMAASPLPLADALLSRADDALGFDWLAWYEWVNAHQTLHCVLAYAYSSVPVQISGLIFYFCYADAKRVHQLILAGMLSIIMIAPIMMLLPAVGAWSQYNVGIVEPWRDDILALRSHTLLTIGRMNGIVSFPSFHTVLGILFANMACGRKWFLPVLVLNLFMIASVMSEGAHYAVDMLSGLAVAFAALGATRFLLAWCQPVTTA